MRYVYPCILAPEEGGGFFATFPDVPGANTCGDDRADALEMAEDALAVALAGYVHQQWDIPIPSSAKPDQIPVVVPPIVAAKLALYSAMREQGVTRAGLAMRLGLSEAAVARLLNPDRRSPISRIEKALRIVGRRIAVEDRAAQDSRIGA